MNKPLRVAVIGAGGIGQHHARWYHLSGCEVVAFAGTSEASCARTRERLANYFGFNGQAYTNVERMLKEVTPDIVDVSSPYAMHREHVLAALQAGAHVVCEKPLCWDESKELDEILQDGREMVDAAAQAGRLMGVTAQYPSSIPVYRELYEQVRGAWDPVETLYMEMEVKGRKGRKLGEEIWVDVGPHPLSLVIGFLPEGRIDFDGATFEISERGNRAEFLCTGPQGDCRVELVLRDIAEGSPVRRFGVNDFLVDWEGYADEKGVYRALLKHGEDVIRCNDFLHLWIESFARVVRGEGGAVPVSGEDGLRNLEYQVEFLRRLM
ncbi:MAG: Gfo/Idh/MocA family oxidoreductase [bacterium]|nr:Gfo/Idh/MocA family oxidoreductase [bacterium]